eukprot:TRINITY_DN1663_c0_g1_i1.p1 TRINITY_DN1663_c0_g1~~TRINITY_DN1663_c0_g1_i1.p1  ORF type:complete len:1002 (+),score=251.01 TRINITY_DN1663_c0_g1_i1:126-3131(+)
MATDKLSWRAEAVQLAGAVVRRAVELYSEKVQARQLAGTIAPLAVRHAVRRAAAVEAVRQPEVQQSDELEELRQQVRRDLLDGARTGKLEEAVTTTTASKSARLAAPPVQQAAAASLDAQAVRLHAQGLLLGGLKDGTLAAALAQVKKPPATKQPDAQAVRLRAQGLLLGGAKDGTLAAALAQVKEPRATKQSDVEPPRDLELRILSLRGLGRSYTRGLFVQVEVAELNFRQQFPAGPGQQTLLLRGLQPDCGVLQLRMAVCCGEQEPSLGKPEKLLGGAVLTLLDLEFDGAWQGDLLLVDDQGFPSGGLLSVAVGQSEGSTAAIPPVRTSLAAANNQVDGVAGELEFTTGVNHAKKLGAGDMLVAAYDYQAQRGDELAIRQGDTMAVVGMDDTDEGWYQVKMPDGRSGLIPCNFVQVLEVAVPVPAAGRRQEAKACARLLLNSAVKKAAASPEAGGDEEPRLTGQKSDLQEAHAAAAKALADHSDTLSPKSRANDPQEAHAAVAKALADHSDALSPKSRANDPQEAYAAAAHALVAHSARLPPKNQASESQERQMAVAQGLAAHVTKLQPPPQGQAAGEMAVAQGLAAHITKLQQQPPQGQAAGDLEVKQLQSDEKPTAAPPQEVQLQAKIAKALHDAASSGELEKALKEVFLQDLTKLLHDAAESGELEKAMQEVFGEQAEAAAVDEPESTAAEPSHEDSELKSARPYDEEDNVLPEPELPPPGFADTPTALGLGRVSEEQPSQPPGPAAEETGFEARDAVPIQVPAAVKPAKKRPGRRLLGNSMSEATSSAKTLHPGKASYGLPPPTRPTPSYPEWKPPSRGPGSTRLDFRAAPGPDVERIVDGWPMRPPGRAPAYRPPRKGFDKVLAKHPLQARDLEQLPPIWKTAGRGGEVMSREQLYLSAMEKVSAPQAQAGAARVSPRGGLGGGAGGGQRSREDLRPSDRQGSVEMPMLPAVDAQVDAWRQMIAESAMRFAKATDLPRGVLLRSGALALRGQRG